MRQSTLDITNANVLPSGAAPLDEQRVWSLLLLLAERARRGAPVAGRASYALRDELWVEVSAEQAELTIDASCGRANFASRACASGEVRALLELFLPLVVGARAATLVVGHLGQSLDGRVATPTGVSQFITGREDIVHTHRLRALCAAVLVGVRTVQLDDPQLTTRLVPGSHPTRVILDPQAKLEHGFRVLEDDAAATLVCTANEHAPRVRRRGHVEWLGVACRAGRFDPRELLRVLRARGLGRVFIEGGGETISRFLAVRALDRLHVGVAPMILGSGAPAFALPPIDRLDEALSLRCRHFALGNDLLFDCELASAVAPGE